MSKPIIDRRCPHCGVSIRERAFFCPQCGKQLDWGKIDEDADGAKAHPDFDKTIAETQTESEVGASSSAGPELPTETVGVPDQNRRRRDGGQLPRADQSLQQPPVKNERSGVRTTRREVEDNVLQRVERLRKVSTVVIDQASYDPSLRFILVAAVLFGLFVLIVILSKLIG